MTQRDSFIAMKEGLEQLNIFLSLLQNNYSLLIYDLDLLHLWTMLPLKVNQEMMSQNYPI